MSLLIRRASERAGWFLAALALLLLVGCGNGPVSQHRPTPTRTGARPVATLAPTPTSGISRVPYPWPMTKTTTSFGTTIWRPADPAVKKEMQADFLTFWAWTGHEQPSVILHFVPDVSLIVRLATSDEAPQLQAYADQVRSSGQLVTYTGKQFIQNVKTCTQDGLQCSNLYSFGQTVKTVYRTSDGSVLSTTTAPNFIVTVTVLQVYSRELHLWQLASVQISEVSA